MSIRVVSFNINSLRARPHQLAAIVEAYHPDVIALQETKVDDAQFPQADIEALGYQAYFHGQKGHYGVALLTRVQPNWVIKGFPGDAVDAQRRWIGCELKQADGRALVIWNGYFPQGESRDHPLKFPCKQRFYSDLQQFLVPYLQQDIDLIVTGDFNIGPQAQDVGIGEANEKRWLSSGKCCFLPEERQWFADTLKLGLQDTYRYHYPEERRYSWFDYRSRGFEDEPKRGLRIDFVLANESLLSRTLAAGIDHDIRGMEKPSDHCPVWAEFSGALMDKKWRLHNFN
jgi:exodeoxyribonuclease-3